MHFRGFIEHIRYSTIFGLTLDSLKRDILTRILKHICRSTCTDNGWLYYKENHSYQRYVCLLEWFLLWYCSLHCFSIRLYIEEWQVFWVLISLIIANESFKWDDVSHAIKSKQLTQWNKSLFLHNSNYGKSSVDSYDKSEPDDTLPLTSVKQMRNIYNRGVYANTKEVLFPRRVD